MKTQLLVFATFFATLVSSEDAQDLQLPDFIKVCHAKDPKLNECVKNSIMALKPHLASGIPDLAIPSCEPLEIKRIELNQNNGPINLSSRFDNIKIFGLSQFRIRAVRIDVAKAKFRLRLWFPELYMTADYSVKGKFLMMPMMGKGKSFGNFTDVDAVCSLKSDLVTRENESSQYMKVKDIFAEFNIGNAQVRLENLFEGQQGATLTAALTNFFNENWRTVTAEVKPELELFISKFLHKATSALFSKYPYNLLLPDGRLTQ